jgi:hypothetical protein
MNEKIIDLDWCLMRTGGEPIPSVDFCNGAVMTFDKQGKMTSRRGGLFWTMECKYNKEGDLLEYSNGFGYKVRGQWDAERKCYKLNWKTPKNDVFLIRYQLAQRKQLLADLKSK